MKTVEELPLAPRYLGNLLYPGGAPVRKENVSYKDRTIQELIFLRANDEQLSEEEEYFIKQYIIYYAHSPIFDLNPDDEFMKEFRDQLDLSRTVDELIEICLEYGLDPL